MHGEAERASVWPPSQGHGAITIWDERSFKAVLKERAKASGLPNWSLSDHIRYVLRESCGMWHEPYKPTQKAPSKT